MTPRIVWLASYPKSGNTWVRVFLSNLTQQAEISADLNNLRHSAISSDRQMLDNALGFNTGDLGREECARLRPVAYRWMNAQLGEPVYCKTHDACDDLPNGDWLMAPDATDKVVYIVRNPLDVAVSMAHANRQSLDAVIETLGDPDARIARQEPDRQDWQVEQRLGTWSDHVQSWTQNEHFKTHVVRYEDLKAAPHVAFSQITTFLDLPHTTAQQDQAIRNSAFDTLQLQENTAGFRERPQPAEQFFRRGKVGDWQGTLSGRHIDKALQDHLPVMREFGYANNDGTPRLA